MKFEIACRNFYWDQGESFNEKTGDKNHVGLPLKVPLYNRKANKPIRDKPIIVTYSLL
jgi:hypothetical protein